MSIFLALDPALPLSPRAFAAAWNADPRTDDLAKADLRTGGLDAGELDADGRAGGRAAAALDGAGGVDELVVLETAATPMPVSAAALYDLIQDILRQGGLAGPARIAEQSAPDGSVLLQISAAADD